MLKKKNTLLLVFNLHFGLFKQNPKGLANDKDTRITQEILRVLGVQCQEPGTKARQILI